jgi:hypothetical protein
MQLHGLADVGTVDEAVRDDPRFPALKAKVGLWNQVRSF